MNSSFSDNQLRHLLKDVPVGILILRGPEFVVELASAAYLQLVDRKEEELIGKPLFDALPEVKERVEALLNSVFSTGVPYHGHEFPVPLNRYGKREICYFNFTYAPAYEPDGNISGITVVANEVTHSVIARQNIEESEAKFRSTVLHAHFATAIFLGEDMVIDLTNKKVLDLWQRTEGEVIGRKITDVLPEIVEQGFDKVLLQVYHDGVPYYAYETLVYLDGNSGRRTVYLDFAYEPLFDRNQNVFGIIVTAIDVTDRVAARTKLEEAEERSRLAIESAQLGAYEIEVPTGKFKFSKRILEIYGLDDKASYEDFIACFHPEDRPLRDQAHVMARETGKLHYEVRIIRPDKSVIWIGCQGTMFRDDEGQPKTLVGIVQDITDQKNFAEEMERQVQLRTEQLQVANEEIAAANEEIAATNEELAETNRRLLTSNFELEQFNYAASHDLQEPVRKIQTLASYLLTEGHSASKEKITDFLKRIYTSADRMKNLIDDLLLYARDSRTEKQFVQTDLNEVLEAVRSDHDLMIEQKKAKVEIGQLPKLQAIPGQMHQLFRNLLSNSLKFSREGVTPEISIRATSEKGKAHIVFEDNGIGFQQEFADYVFKLFKRLHSKNEYEGTGIGLSLCKKIVENHGGNITAESAPGKGTTIHIILPLYTTED